MKTITFYYDIVCPYAYIASQRIEAVAARCGANIDWQPVLLGGIYKSIEAPQIPSGTWSEPKARLGALDLVRQAASHGISMAFPAGHPRRSVSAMRLLVGVNGAKRVALTHALYRAYWVDGANISDRTVLDALARRHGVEPGVIDRADVRQALFDSTAAAVGQGAFGVPTMVVDGTLYWGQDRLNFIEHTLTGQRTAPMAATGTGKTVRFFHDFSSPFSYLASTQIAAIAARQGASVAWTPILLGALFRAIGTPNVPLMAMTEAKRQYALRDLSDWARWWGVPFSFPTVFPVRTVLPLRVAIAEPQATPHLYRSLWADNRNIGDPAVVASVLTDAGLDGEGLVARASDPVVKATLRSNTEAAQTAGACGVPTFAVDGGLIWGQDRMDLLESVLAGGFSL